MLVTALRQRLKWHVGAIVQRPLASEGQQGSLQDVFQRRIAGVPHLIRVERLHAGMNRPEAITEVVQRVTGNVLAPICGGGDPALLEVSTTSPCCKRGLAEQHSKLSVLATKEWAHL
jgi:hypothetical protein